MINLKIAFSKAEIGIQEFVAGFEHRIYDTQSPINQFKTP